jgi:hypothetical protein
MRLACALRCIVEKAKSPRRIISAMMLLIGSYFLFVLVFGGIEPGSYNRTVMWVIKRRILKFAHQNDRLPKDLSELPIMPGYHNGLNDWWGNPIQLEMDDKGIASLKSAGGILWLHDAKDGVPLALRFPTKTSTGEWSDELVNFLKDD